MRIPKSGRSTRSIQAPFYGNSREANVSAVAAASIYHFTEQTPLEAKRYLAQQGFRTRL